MFPSILLLDCHYTLVDKLKKQGFDVEFGSIGFTNGVRNLPSQIYEKDILIYNPTHMLKIGDKYIVANNINDLTPEYSLTHLENHIRRGATLLIFLNRIADHIAYLNEAYRWIPFMPQIHFTKDQKPLAAPVNDYYGSEHLAPLVLLEDLKIPVMQKVIAPERTPSISPKDVVTIYYNRNSEVLGVLLRRGEGQLIILPEHKSNEDIINIFLKRVLPKIYELGAQIPLIDKFISPEERKFHEAIEKIENDINEFNQKLYETKEKTETAKRNKIQRIKSDDTAVLILNYYDLALQQEDVALFYVYKIIEAIENKYGAESTAKNKLGCNTEWNLIGKLSNASYADIRHAPKPGEKIKDWTPEEIKSCFEAAEKIINAYLTTLFK